MQIGKTSSMGRGGGDRTSGSIGLWSLRPCIGSGKARLRSIGVWRLNRSGFGRLTGPTPAGRRGSVQEEADRERWRERSGEGADREREELERRR